MRITERIHCELTAEKRSYNKWDKMASNSFWGAMNKVEKECKNVQFIVKAPGSCDEESSNGKPVFWQVVMPEVIVKIDNKEKTLGKIAICDLGMMGGPGPSTERMIYDRIIANI